MPITLPENLLAFDILSREGVMVMTPGRAATQDIRPLRIGLVNLMPKKIQTENQFARLIGAIRFTSGADRDRLRTHLLDLFEVVGPDDPAVARARIDLANALF